MKNNKNYALLERKIFIKFCLILLTIVVGLFTIASLIRGTFGNTIVSLLQDVFYFSMDEAVYFYQQTIRSNVYIIMILILLIIIIFMFRMLLSSITKYFDVIDNAVENLTTSKKEITLPPELSFMEIKFQMCQDILEKKEQNARIAEQKKNDLVVYLAHDIKTPLTSVIGYLELMQEIPDMPMKQRAKYMQITLDKANRLEQLINEFFEITRFNLNTIVLQKKVFNLTFMLEQLVDEFYPMLQTKNNTISLSLPENIMISGDSDKLSRVFNNILKNAISYSYADSEIQISVIEKEQYIETTITNVGAPIAKHQLDTIFEKFYRLDSARSSRTGGAGLGLAIAKEIVLAHNGTISATSDENGTSFVVTIPKT